MLVPVSMGVFVSPVMQIIALLLAGTNDSDPSAAIILVGEVLPLTSMSYSAK